MHDISLALIGRLGPAILEYAPLLVPCGCEGDANARIVSFTKYVSPSSAIRASDPKQEKRVEPSRMIGASSDARAYGACSWSTTPSHRSITKHDISSPGWFVGGCQLHNPPARGQGDPRRAEGSRYHRSQV